MQTPRFRLSEGLEVARHDPLGGLALAVVQLALVEASRGDAEARAWLDQLRADLVEAAPVHLAERWVRWVRRAA